MIWLLNWDRITSPPHRNQVTAIRQNLVTLNHQNLPIPSPLRLKNQEKQLKSQRQNTQLLGQQLNIQPKQLQNIQHQNQSIVTTPSDISLSRFFICISWISSLEPPV